MNQENKSFWLKNMIVLGHGAPNKVSKVPGAHGRCACIWSEKTGYCRIYPIPYGYLYDWEIIDVEVRKPNNDGRENTFIIYNYETDWKKMYEHIKIHKTDKGNRIKLTKEEWIPIVKKLANDSFSLTRDNKRSFGIIKPKSINCFLRKNKEISSQQTTLVDYDNFVMDQDDYKWFPYVEYSCEKECKSKHPHTSKIIEWGCFQWMKKKPNDEEHCKQVFDNLGINKIGWENYLLIGNIRPYPKTYIVVKVIRWKK